MSPANRRFPAEGDISLMTSGLAGTADGAAERGMDCKLDRGWEAADGLEEDTAAVGIDLDMGGGRYSLESSVE